jgi:hypothetical protein
MRLPVVSSIGPNVSEESVDPEDGGAMFLRNMKRGVISYIIQLFIISSYSVSSKIYETQTCIKLQIMIIRSVS